MKPFIDTVDISVRYKPLTPKPFAPKTGEIALRKYLNKARIFKRNSQSKIFLQPSLKKKLRQRFLMQEQNPFKRKYLNPLLRGVDEEEKLVKYRKQYNDKLLLDTKDFVAPSIESMIAAKIKSLEEGNGGDLDEEFLKNVQLPEHFQYEPPSPDFNKAISELREFPGKTTSFESSALVDFEPFELLHFDENKSSKLDEPEYYLEQLKNASSGIRNPENSVPTLRENTTKILKRIAKEIDDKLFSGPYTTDELDKDMSHFKDFISSGIFTYPSMDRQEFFSWWLRNTKNSGNKEVMEALKRSINKYFNTKNPKALKEAHWPTQRK